jgi:hypothetical protein
LLWSYFLYCLFRCLDQPSSQPSVQPSGKYVFCLVSRVVRQNHTVAG